MRIHLAPPLLARRDPRTGHLEKKAYGPWIWPVLRRLARLKRLRGTRLDPFGWTAERRLERQLIVDYEATIEEILAVLGPEVHPVAVELASLPEKIRGFGHVKQRHLRAATRRAGELRAALRRPAAHEPRLSAAE
jgi:indolepyruvate ferredoxin oxidoreductase